MDPNKFDQPKNIILAQGGHTLRFMDLFRLSLRVFRVRPLRTFLTILGISIGIGTVLFLVSLGYGLQYILIGRLAATEDSLVTLEAFYPQESNLSINKEEANSIGSLPDASEINPLSELIGEITTQDVSGSVIVKLTYPNYFRLSGIKPDVGEVFTDTKDGVVVSTNALKLLGITDEISAIGKEVQMQVAYTDMEGNVLGVASSTRSQKIIGIITDEIESPFVIASIKTMTTEPQYYQRVYVKAKDIDSVEILRNKLIEKGYIISARVDLVNQAKKIMSVVTAVLGIFGVTALLVSAIGMFNTMIIGFLERIFEVGIMKSIGATVQDIRNLFLMESLVIGLLGGIGGVIMGIGGGELFNLGLNFLANYLGGKPVDLFIYPVNFLGFIIILSGLVGIFAGFWPARRAAVLSAREAFLKK